MSAVVSDTSPLQYLVLCGAVNILPVLFRDVLIPPTVFKALQHAHTPLPVREWAQELPGWVRVQAPVRLDASLEVDEGEREAISLAREVQATAVLIDDHKGRLAALRCGLRVTGTVGLLEAGADRGLLNLSKAVELLRETNARLDDDLIRAALLRDRSRQISRGPRPPA